MTKSGPDFGRTARDYGRHRAGFPRGLFDRLAEYGIGRRGQRVVDLGTGTGTVARGLALRGCSVTGIDRSDALMSEARRLDTEAGVTVSYVIATAEETGLADASCDVVTAGQCWHWFDRPRVAQEVRRLLAAQGRLVIAHFDWLPLPGNVVDATERLILAHNPRWTMAGSDGMYPAWLRDVAVAGFVGIETFSFDIDVPYSHTAWRGRVRASGGIGASLAPDAIQRFDAEHAALLAADFADDPIAVPHRVWALVCRRN